MSPRLLDLFCCEGGSSAGYWMAGFQVVGIDKWRKRRYPFPFYERDITELRPDWGFLQDFDAIHASPPCQSYSTMSNRFGSSSPELISWTRDFLEATGLPWIIENVPGARPHMRDPILLHGGHFGLNLNRPRLFESNVALSPPLPAKRVKDAAAVYGRSGVPRTLAKRKDGSELRSSTIEEAREAMGMPWASWDGLREAVPPSYTLFLGEQLIRLIR